MINEVNPNLANNNGTTPLMIASLNRHGDVIQLLLEKHSNKHPGQGKIYSISCASQNGLVSVISTLLSNGADPSLAKNNGFMALIDSQ